MADKFDVARPDGNAKVSVGDDALRENARTLKASLEVEHQPFNASLEADGRHKFPRLTKAARDALVTPPTGHLVFVTDRPWISVYSGSAWLNYDVLDVGDLKMAAYDVATPPDGWLACDGAIVSRTTYAALFAKIGTAFGVGDGSTTFGLPNFKGSVPVHIDAAQTEFNLRGKVGGAKTHTLVTAEVPAHDHAGASMTTTGDHTHAVIANLGGDAVLLTGTRFQRAQNAATSGSMNSPTNAGDHTHVLTIPSVGGGGAHNNLQPYVVVGFLIKT